MSYKEIISSGLLEQYAMDLLSPSETLLVEEYLLRYPELSEELKKIQAALGQYALERGIDAPDGLKEKIMSQLRVSNIASNKIPENKKKKSNSNWLDYLSAFLLAGLMISFWSNHQLKSENADYKKRWQECDSLMNEKSAVNDIYADISKPENKIVAFEATPDYKGLSLFLVQDTLSRKNYIQMVNIPELTDAESLQLWSLKPGSDPVPLNVFRKENSIFVEVIFEEGTDAYAVTIEPREGSQVPNLKKLIGVAKV